ncbi:hypothetical protein OGAPHI_005142 [Ogataea philodendri]|uniref:Uncharacterized protein n=1 Tax=Ogataea philodendri TaxID=1378263 RepID=A0A9P8T384_9ASCO|nr:uncharacterized protein OGAPHI_005142 [Ogataea philodendri]KAH3663740.1 hypothetical protein OGAPHI_005142 [Ogataea philodendri]
MRNRNPSICLCLDVSFNDVFDWFRHTWHVPWNIGLPTSPCFAQVLQNSLALILFDTFRYHIENVVKNGSTKLQVVIRIDSLFGDCLRHFFALSSFKLTRKQVSKPTFQKWHNSSHEEDPHTPGRLPESATWSFSNNSVESVVNNVFQVLTSSDLVHNFVLVTVDTRQLPKMVQSVVDTVCELESVNVSEPELNMRINN